MRASLVCSWTGVLLAPLSIVAAIDVGSMQRKPPPAITRPPTAEKRRLPTAQEAERAAHANAPVMPDVLPPSEHWEVKHMRDEHHLDSYDDEFFFRTHDIDSTGYWTPQDIAALYGITGGFEQMEPIAGGEGKVAEVTDDVMQQLDTDRNGKIQLDEWLVFKKRGGQLKSYGFAGHHEDFELAYDLHHVEKYHADDPEGSEATWSHPEDIEHFKKHDEIFHGHANEDPLANIPLKFRKKGL